MRNLLSRFTAAIVILIAAVVIYQFTPISSHLLCPVVPKPHFNMPLVQPDLPPLATSYEPVGKRDASVRFYLQCAVRIKNGGVRGSGTICYYDPVKNEAWVISCGHLFNGSMRPGSETKTVQIDVFYKNDEKLAEPQSYPAEVICYDNSVDISFLKFKPDWVPQHYFPIASLDYKIEPGQRFESTGCDHAKEVAAYTIEIVEGVNSGSNLVTRNNSPRPGRSGGGLLTQDGKFIAICWGTSDTDGSGYGFFVPLRKIHAYAKQFKEVAWLLNVQASPGFFFQFPIIDEHGVIRQLPDRYIPTP